MIIYGIEHCTETWGQYRTPDPWDELDQDELYVNREDAERRCAELNASTLRVVEQRIQRDYDAAYRSWQEHMALHSAGLRKDPRNEPVKAEAKLTRSDGYYDVVELTVK